MFAEFDNSKTGALMVMGMMMVLAAGLMILAQTQMPDPVLVRPGSHAEIRHGMDALTVRLAVYNCDPRYFRTFVSDGINPKSVGKWLFVCPDSAYHRCAGIITPTVFEKGYDETTAYLASCGYWLNTVPTRDGYVPTSVVAVKKAMGLILAMEIYDANNRD